MATKEEVRQALRQVLDPEIGKPIEDIGMLKDIAVQDGTVQVDVLITIEGCPLKDRIDRDVKAAVMPLPGVRNVNVVLSPMSEEERAALVAKLRGAPAGSPPPQQAFFTDGKTSVIAVASGQGGVGKSSVTVNLAGALAGEGHRVRGVGVDVWGVSVPRMLGGQ